jgi:hypothetical protein
VTSYSSLLTTTQENDSSDDEDDDEEKNHKLRAVMTTFERDRAIHRFKEEKRILPEELNESIAYSELEYEDQYEEVEDVKNYFRALKLAKRVVAWVEAANKARRWGKGGQKRSRPDYKEDEEQEQEVEGPPSPRQSGPSSSSLVSCLLATGGTRTRPACSGISTMATSRSLTRWPGGHVVCYRGGSCFSSRGTISRSSSVPSRRPSER